MRTRKQYKAVLNRALGHAAQASRVLPDRRAPGTAQRSWNLARAILARYAAIERRWPGIALVFKAPEYAGVSASNTYNVTHPSIFLSPRVILRMLISRQDRLVHAVADRTPAQPFGRMPAHKTFEAFPGHKQEPKKNEAVVARIVQRALRHEIPCKITIRPTEAASAPLTQVAPVKNVPSARSASLARVFRRGARAIDEGPAVPVTAPTEREGPGPAANRGTDAAHGMQSPADIKRITDQVLHALDRRIVAQRERMGMA